MLASPVFVVALVTLIINDHVLKQAWPGLVTGKLSDVAGLVVAPLLLAVPLVAVGVRRPVPAAIAATGAGFVFAKTSVAGAAATSAVWSLSGVPTLIRADVTDLVALPALGVAWWVDRHVRRSPARPWRRTVAAASGMAILPVAVLATAATSCDEGASFTGVSRVKGDFRGRPRIVEQRLVLRDGGTSTLTIDTARAIQRELVEVSPYDDQVLEQCDSTDRDQCWRILDDNIVVEQKEGVSVEHAVDGVSVEHSVDGGRTWAAELELSEDQIEVIRDDTDGCGGAGWVKGFDLGVLSSDGEPIVVVPIGEGGAFIRGDDGRWDRYSRDRLYDEAAEQASESKLTLEPLDQPPPTEDPTGDPTGEVTPTCATPSPTTVTPNPSNGPPTTYDVCP